MAELHLPTVDFGTLGELGNIYRKANADQARQQTLSSLGQGGGVDANTLLRSGDLSLAQLGIQMQNKQSEDAWRQQEAKRSQSNADRSFGLQARAANRADEGPVETAGQRAQAAAKFGLTPENPAFKPFVLTGKLPEADTTFQNTIEQRKQAALSNGLAPDSPGFQSFVLTGKMPREDAQPLTATDKKAIMEADEGVMTAKTGIDALNTAKGLSAKAFSGPYASERGYAASFLGDSSDLGKRGVATAELNNVVTSNALTQLKAIFGAAPTEGERKILLDIQGSVNQPHEVRSKIFERAKALADVRLKFNEQRSNELRGGTFYKPPGARAPQTPGVPQAEAAPQTPQQANVTSSGVKWSIE